MIATANTGRSRAERDDYSDDELEFIKAIEKYKKEHRRPFPTFTEVLEVLKSLEYTKQEK